MAKNKRDFDRSAPIKNILYIFAVLGLIALILLMYMNYRSRKAEYAQLVREASETETLFELQARELEPSAPADEPGEAAEAEPEATVPAVEEAPTQAAADLEVEGDLKESEQDFLSAVMEKQENAPTPTATGTPWPTATPAPSGTPYNPFAPAQ